MKNIYLLAALCALLFAGCSERFEKLNANGNAPENVSPQFLLSNVIWEASNSNTRQGWLSGNMLAQHTSNLEFLPVDRYDLGTNTELWNSYYHLLNDLEVMRAAAEGNLAFEGVADILKAWLGAQLTDLWTDVPFSMATQGASEGNFTPVYDTQEAAYTGDGGILDLLRNAATTLAGTNDVLSGDIMFDGDLNGWIRFANSLRFRYLLRISNRAQVGAEMDDILLGGMVFQSNFDNASVDYLASAPNQWFIFNERIGRYTDVRMSSSADSILEALDDPRIEVMYKPTNASAGTQTEVYDGLPNGLSRDSQNAFDLNDVSLVGAKFRDQPDGTEAVFMRYDELQFAIAEAISRGLIGGSASMHYEDGITASFENYGANLAPGYLSSNAVTLDGSDDLNRILTQKWIALFMNGHEAWFNIRRTGFPVLPLPADNLNGDVFPVRFRYPSSEQAVNSTNYNDAVSRIGADDYNSKGWWEQ